MFKLVVLCSLFAIALAAPGHLGYVAGPVVSHAAVVHEPVVAKVGAIFESVPSAVSHQSQTVVHGHNHIVTPVLAPAVQTYVAPVVSGYHAPLLKTYTAPVAHGWHY